STNQSIVASVPKAIACMSLSHTIVMSCARMRGSSNTKSCTRKAAKARRQPTRSQGGGGTSILIGIVPFPDDEDRAPDDHQVEAQRPIPQVVEVVLDAHAHLLERLGLPAQPIHLRPAGDP